MADNRAGRNWASTLGDFADSINKISQAGVQTAGNIYAAKQAFKGRDPAVYSADQAAVVEENRQLREYLRGQGAPGQVPTGGIAEAAIFGGSSGTLMILGAALLAVILLRE